MTATNEPGHCFQPSGGGGADGWSDGGSVDNGGGRRTSTHGDAIGAFDLALGMDGDEDDSDARRQTFDPRRASRGPNGVAQSGGVGGSLSLKFVHEGPDSEYSYFDTCGSGAKSGGGTLKEQHSWAGPTYWKFMGHRAAASNRAKRLKSSGGTDGVLIKCEAGDEQMDGVEGENGTKKNKSRKTAKQRVWVDFGGPSVKVKTQFALPGNKAPSLQLPKTLRSIKLPEALKVSYIHAHIYK
jgi:hypothetical protein